MSTPLQRNFFCLALERAFATGFFEESSVLLVAGPSPFFGRHQTTKELHVALDRICLMQFEFGGWLPSGSQQLVQPKHEEII